MKSTVGPSAQRIALIILPGLDGTDVFFRPFMERLPESIGAEVICYPQDGSGDYAELLARVRAAIAEVPAFYVLGASFGGPLAIQLTAAEPDKVRGLILCASFARAPMRRLARLRFAIVGPIVWLLRVARRLPVWTARRRNDPMRLAKAETWARVPARALAARARAALAADVRSQLGRCAAPVLAIEFAEDTVVRPQQIDEICGAQPAALRLKLRGDHLGMHGDPAPLAAAVSQFIQEVEAGSIKPGLS